MTTGIVIFFLAFCTALMAVGIIYADKGDDKK